MGEVCSQDILDVLPEGLLVVDARGEIRWANRAARDLLGEDPIPLLEWEHRLGWTPADGGPPLDARILDTDAVLQGLPPSVWVAPPTGGEPGEPRYWEVEIRPWTDPEDPVGKALVRVREVTDLHLQRSALERDRCFLESIVENVPAMVFLKEARHLRFVRFNRAGEELLGLSREDLIGRNDHDFFPKDQADFFTERDREALQARDPVDIPEEPIQTAHGLRWLHTRKVPIRDARGEPAFLLGISVDITEQKTATMALEKAREAVHGVRAGHFVPRPPDDGCPPYCPAAAFCWHCRPRYRG